MGYLWLDFQVFKSRKLREPRKSSVIYTEMEVFVEHTKVFIWPLHNPFLALAERQRNITKELWVGSPNNLQSLLWKVIDVDFSSQAVLKCISIYIRPEGNTQMKSLGAVLQLDILYSVVHVSLCSPLNHGGIIAATGMTSFPWTHFN